MPPPLPRCSGWAHSSLKLAHPYQPSPKPLSGRPAHRPFRGLLGVHSRCGLHTRAVTTIVTVIRRLQTFRRLHACSGCFRLERSPGGPCTHWKSAAFSRRTRMADNLRRTIEAEGDMLGDLHLWRLGPGHLGAIVAVVTQELRGPEYYRAKLARFRALSHLTIQVEQSTGYLNVS